MTTTLTMVPLQKIKPREGFNPRSEFGDEQMAELVESIRLHGIITPLTLAPDGDGFVIVAGERRYRAAKRAKLKEVPAQVRDVDGDALTLAVAENVIRADLNPVEEARAYERLVMEDGGAGKVAKLVGRSEKLIGERLDLLRLPNRGASAARRPEGAACLRVRPDPDRGARTAAGRPDGRVARRPATRGGALPRRPGRGGRRRARGRMAGRRPVAPPGRV